MAESGDPDQREEVNFYPVRVCAAGLSVWFRPYVYLYAVAREPVPVPKYNA